MGPGGEVLSFALELRQKSPRRGEILLTPAGAAPRDMAMIQE